MDENRKTWTHPAGVAFSSSRSWASSTVDALLALHKASSGGLQNVRQNEDASRTCFWTVGPLCSQAPATLHGAPLHHELMAAPPPMTREEYYAYISGPTWLKRSRSIKKASDWTCAQCHYHGYNCQAAHKHYGNLGAELPSDLMCLCDRCHAQSHGKPPRT